jgi:hypothetical protein
MAEYSKRNGVTTATLSKMSGIEKATRSKFNGDEFPVGTACRWIAGASGGKLFTTVVADASSGWEELVNGNWGNAKDLAYGKNNDGTKNRWVIGGTNVGTEINYADAGMTDLTNPSSYTNVAVAYDGTNMIAVDGFAEICWGDTDQEGSMWLSGGTKSTTVDDVTGYKLSTDGGDNWTVVDPSDLPDANGDTPRNSYFAGGNTWFTSNSSGIWKYEYDGGWAWTDMSVSIGGDIYGMSSGSDAGEGSPTKPNLWVAVGNQGAIGWSDDDWATANTSADTKGNGPFDNPDLLMGNAQNHKGMSVVYAAGTINRWVAVSKKATAGEHSPYCGVIAYSTDGTDNWTAATLSGYGVGVADFVAVATDNTTIVAVSTTGEIFTSADGETFTYQTVTGTPVFRSIACDVTWADLGRVGLPD